MLIYRQIFTRPEGKLEIFLLSQLTVEKFLMKATSLGVMSNLSLYSSIAFRMANSCGPEVGAPEAITWERYIEDQTF